MKGEITSFAAVPAEELRGAIMLELKGLTNEQLAEFVNIISSLRRGVLPTCVQVRYQEFLKVPYESPP